MGIAVSALGAQGPWEDNVKFLLERVSCVEAELREVGFGDKGPQQEQEPEPVAETEAGAPAHVHDTLVVEQEGAGFVNFASGMQHQRGDWAAPAAVGNRGLLVDTCPADPLAAPLPLEPQKPEGPKHTPVGALGQESTGLLGQLLEPGGSLAHSYADL